ncbi:MAG TPA: MFS transporter [Holophagaceae bacterium]|jgi:DHA1 family tetracycline resistance protein-like MFS transporter|nr:MFS transporter [Holophagaceae bacterium]
MSDARKARLAIFLTVFVDLLGFGIVIPILPLYAEQVASSSASHWTSAVTGWMHLANPGAFWAGVVFVSFSLMQFIATPILGRISDRTGRRPVLWISLLGSAVAYLLMALTMRLEWVILARVVDGITGGNIAVAQAAMADGSKPEERSKVLGMIGAAFGLGFVLGPALAGILAGSSLGVSMLRDHGWHLPFLVAAGLSFLASLLVILWLPETLTPELRARAKAKEGRGHALATALRTKGMPQLLTIALLAMSGFAMMEGTFSLLAAARFSFGQRDVGYLFAFVGILIVLYQGGLVRVMAKRVPERAAIWTGLALMALALPLLPRLPWKWPFLLMMVPLAWGNGMNATATQALASQLTPAEHQGSLFGAMSAVQGLGRILGPLAGTLLFAKWGFASPYSVAAGVVSVAFLLALSLPKPSKRGPASPDLEEAAIESQYL